MTISQKFAEMGAAIGLDASKCKTGNIAETINALTMDMGGEVSTDGNISTAVSNFMAAVGEQGGSTGYIVNEDSALVPVKKGL